MSSPPPGPARWDAVVDGTHLAFEPADAERHGPLVQQWGRQPHVAPWWRLGGSLAEVRGYLTDQRALPHLVPWVAALEGRPFAYVETYAAARDPLAAHYAAEPGDQGWHVLVGPPELLGTGASRLLGRAVLAHLLAVPGADRVVCEPDVRNTRMLRHCHALGHEQLAEVDLPDKRAALLVCTRAAFVARWPHDLAATTSVEARP